MASCGTITKDTFFYPAREGIGRGFHLSAGEPVLFVPNPYSGAPIACTTREGNDYIAAVLPADIVGGWDPVAAGRDD